VHDQEEPAWVGRLFAVCGVCIQHGGHSTTQLCPFEVVYGFKPITPLDLLPLRIQEGVNMEASKRVYFVRKIHVKTKEAIEKKRKYTADHAN
jgi:hypothetical protein